MIWKPWTLFTVAVAGWMSQQQQEVIAYLREENKILREKLGRKLPLPTVLECFCKYLKASRTFKSYKNDYSRLRCFFGPICESLQLGKSPGSKGPAADKFAGALGSVDNFKELVDMGYQFISIGADVVGLWQYYRELMSAIVGSSVASPESIYLGKE